MRRVKPFALLAVLVVLPLAVLVLQNRQACFRFAKRLVRVVEARTGSEGGAEPIALTESSEPEPARYRVREGHPRLLLTDLDAIRDKVPSAPDLWRTCIAEAEKTDSEIKEEPQRAARMLCAALISRVGLVEGFSYGNTTDGYAARAIADLMQLKAVVGSHDSIMFHAPIALGYDWLHDRLTPGQRSELVARIEAAIDPANKKTRYDYAIDAHNARDGNGMIAALAIHGEGSRDWVRLYHRDVLFGDDPSLDNYRVAREWYSGGGYGEGFGYVGRQAGNWTCRACWRSATSDASLDLGIFTRFAHWLAYRCRPPLYGQSLSDSPVCSYGGEPMSSSGFYQQLAALTGESDRDPEAAALARWLIDASKGMPAVSRADPAGGVLFGLVIGDPRVEGRSPNELRLPYEFEMIRPGECHAVSDWTPDRTHVSFACAWRNDRLKMNGDVMIMKGERILLGNRDGIHHHHYGETWFRNVVNFFRGDELVLDPDHLGGEIVGSFAREGDWYVGECGKDYMSPDVETVRRRFRYDRESNTVHVEDEIHCSGGLVPRTSWNTPLKPAVAGNRVTFVNGPAKAVAVFDGAAEIKIVGGESDGDWGRAYNGSLPSEELFIEKYRAFTRKPRDEQVMRGGYYTVFVTPAKSDDSTYRLATTIHIDD